MKSVRQIWSEMDFATILLSYSSLAVIKPYASLGFKYQYSALIVPNEGTSIKALWTHEFIKYCFHFTFFLCLSKTYIVYACMILKQISYPNEFETNIIPWLVFPNYILRWRKKNRKEMSSLIHPPSQNHFNIYPL